MGIASFNHSGDEFSGRDLVWFAVGWRARQQTRNSKKNMLRAHVDHHDSK